MCGMFRRLRVRLDLVGTTVNCGAIKAFSGFDIGGNSIVSEARVRHVTSCGSRHLVVTLSWDHLIQ